MSPRCTVAPAAGFCLKIWPLGAVSEAALRLFELSDCACNWPRRDPGGEAGEVRRRYVERPPAHPEVDLDTVVHGGAATRRLARDGALGVLVGPHVVQDGSQPLATHGLRRVGAPLTDDPGHRRAGREQVCVGGPRRGRGDGDQDDGQDDPAGGDGGAAARWSPALPRGSALARPRPARSARVQTAGATAAREPGRTPPAGLRARA